MFRGIPSISRRQWPPLAVTCSSSFLIYFRVAPRSDATSTDHDFINVMTYDFHGTWSNHPGHNSPMILNMADPGFEGSLTTSTDLFEKPYGVPRQKLNIGTAFYGYDFQGAKSLWESSLFMPRDWDPSATRRALETQRPPQPVPAQPFRYRRRLEARTPRCSSAA
jgi:GH18 family chitinase